MTEQSERNFMDETAKTEAVQKSFQGKIPESFLIQTPTVISGDYFNHIMVGDKVYALYNPQKFPQRFVKIVPELIKMTLNHVITYSEYWQKRIDGYNKMAEEEGRNKVDPSKVMKLLVTDIPNTGRLDEIATQLKEMANTEGLTDEPNLEKIIRLEAEAKDIIYGGESKQKSLKAFGLEEK